MNILRQWGLKLCLVGVVSIVFGVVGGCDERNFQSQAMTVEADASGMYQDMVSAGGNYEKEVTQLKVSFTDDKGKQLDTTVTVDKMYKMPPNQKVTLQYLPGQAKSTLRLKKEEAGSLAPIALVLGAVFLACGVGLLIFAGRR